LIGSSVQECEESLRELNPAITRTERSAFNGEYVTDDVSTEYLATLHDERRGAKRRSSDGDPGAGFVGGTDTQSRVRPCSSASAPTLALHSLAEDRPQAIVQAALQKIAGKALSAEMTMEARLSGAVTPPDLLQ
jgi:hypothetical protein